MKLIKKLLLFVGVYASLSLFFLPVAAAELVKFKEGGCSFSLPVYDMRNSRPLGKDRTSMEWLRAKE